MKEAITKSRLDSLNVLKREAERTKERLEKLKKLPRSTTVHERKIQLIESALEDYLKDSEKEALTLIEYIEKIPDPKTKEIFMLRYYDGIRSWQKIAFLAGDHDESYVRRLHNAYIKNNPQ